MQQAVTCPHCKTTVRLMGQFSTDAIGAAGSCRATSAVPRYKTTDPKHDVENIYRLGIVEPEVIVVRCDW